MTTSPPAIELPPVPPGPLMPDPLAAPGVLGATAPPPPPPPPPPLPLVLPDPEAKLGDSLIPSRLGGVAVIVPSGLSSSATIPITSLART